MTQLPTAVFLSYASQDAEAARRLAEALRAAGVEVWLDQNELVGGDAWDAKIRGQIAACTLFVPLVSAATQARREGYFRLEWKLAAQRTHMMSARTAFLLPVVIDDTRDAAADVPEEFKAVQWTRLPGGECSEKFCARVGKLLGREATLSAKESPPLNGTNPLPTRGRSGLARRWWRLAALLGAVAGLVFVLRFARPEVGRGNGGAETAHAPAAQATESDSVKWVRQAKSLIDDDPLLVRENYRAASDLCRRALALSPDNAEAWATLSRANLILFSSYHEGGEQLREEARQQAERAMRLAPASADAELAMERYEYQQPGGAANSPARLEALWNRFPRDQRIARRIANVFYLRGDREATKRWAERADALPGGDPTALALIGWEAWFSGRLEEVEPALERALARGPSSSGLHLELIYRNGMGDLEGARSAFDRMPAAVQREDRIVALVVQTHLNTGSPQKAIEALRLSSREFFEQGRQFIPRGFLAGEALSMLGKTRAAEVELRAALKGVEARLTEAPRDTRLVLWRARLLFLLGQKEEAARQYETAIELGQRPDPALLVLLGRPEEAVAEIDLLLNRAQLDWAGLLQSLRNPVFDPLRSNSRFKDIVQRGEGWLAEIRQAGSVERQAAPATLASDEKTVAVLPFANLSGDPAQEYFSDGLTEEILNVLSREKDLRVTARTSAFSFKGKNVPLAEIARTLGVARLVEGSVRRSGDRVRITVQLTRAADGFAENLGSFDRQLTDVFALQDEVARAVLEKIVSRAAAGPAFTTTPTGTINPDAYDAYLRGRALQTKGTLGAEESLAHYRRAVELDPDFAQAWASLAEAASRYYFIGRDRSPARIANIKEALAKARTLKPNLPAILYVAAIVAVDVDHDEALAESLLARAREAGLPDILWHQGNMALAGRRGDLAGFMAHAEPLLRIDPQNAAAIGFTGNFQRNSGAYPEAEKFYLRAYRLTGFGDFAPLGNMVDNRLRWRGPASALRLLDKLAPDHPSSHYLRARLLFWLGRTDEARAAFTLAFAAPDPIRTEGVNWSVGGWLDVNEAKALQPAQIVEAYHDFVRRYDSGDRAPVTLGNLAQLEFLQGRPERARALLAEWESIHRVNFRMGEFNIARLSGLLATIGDSKAALDLLAESWAAGAIPTLDLRDNPRFASLRGDPRFQAWVREAEARSAALPNPVDP